MIGRPEEEDVQVTHGAAVATAREMRRIFLVDDHEMVLEGLRNLLDGHEGFRVVGEAGTRADALARIPATRPDVVIVDLRLPDGDGLSTCRDILVLRPESRVLVLTASDEPIVARQAADAGAAGCLVKTVGCQRIVDAVERVAAGGTVFDDAALASDTIPGTSGTPDENDRLSTLSRIQRQILVLLVDGRTNHHIAEQLGLSDKSVKKHVSAIFVALGATSRVTAAVIATRCASWIDISATAIH